MLTSLIQALINAGNAALSLLPLSPFYGVQQVVVDSEILSWLAWFIPFDAIVALLQAWCVAIGVWYIATKALRWAKMIS
jgi:hypothetical protein